MMDLQPVEGQPGLFRDPQNPETIYNIRDFREGDKYDSIVIPTGLIDFGAEFYFFRDTQNKRNTDTNIKTPQKLSSGESMILDRIGLYVRSSTGQSFPVPQDYKSVLENCYYTLKINDILQDEGPAIKFPSGYGLYGNTQENGQGIVSIGVPATASAARLIKKQLLNQNHQIEGVLRYDQRPWLLAANGGVFATAASLQANVTVQTQTDPPANCGVVMVNLLHGLIQAASTK
ncbi:MAG: hypothetical protein HC882_00345 [Acidobacteria bacterium]|nr:hypothetical protein [Acidobacteriota bacterium]